MTELPAVATDNAAESSRGDMPSSRCWRWRETMNSA